MRTGEHIEKSERLICEAPVVGMNRVNGALGKVNLAPFQHRQQFGADRVNEPHLYIGKELRVMVQIVRNDGFEDRWSKRHFQHASVAMPERLRALSDGAGVIQQAAAVAQQLFALTGYYKAASDAIKKLKAKLVLKIPDLPG